MAYFLAHPAKWTRPHSHQHPRFSDSIYAI